MGKLKRLVTKDDRYNIVNYPFHYDELAKLKEDYQNLPIKKMSLKYNPYAFRSGCLYTENFHTVRLMNSNFCINPFCENFGEGQEIIGCKQTKEKMRYAFNGLNEEKEIKCNVIGPNGKPISSRCISPLVSNSSVACEVGRLIEINSVIDKKTEYRFHKADCPMEGTTPFERKELFYKWGKGSGNTTRWKCKSCNKLTNVLPEQRKNFSFHQKKNRVLPDFCDLIMSRVPVTRVCKLLSIAPKTYYHKLDLLYEKSLEFLDRNETKAFKNIEFKKIWINTDQMLYYLNNVRRRGCGGDDYSNIEDKIFQTHIIGSVDQKSRYALRADIAYDYNVSIEQILKDTIYTNGDHLPNSLRYHDRLRISAAPRIPTKHDTQSLQGFLEEENIFTLRGKYIQGCNVKANYTALAHFILIREMLNAKDWRFISDLDFALIYPVFRAFVNEVKNKNAHYFTCQHPTPMNSKESYRHYIKQKTDLEMWSDMKVIGKDKNWMVQRKILSDLKNSDYWNTKKRLIRGISHDMDSKIEYPLSQIKEGPRYIDCITDASNESLELLSWQMLNANNFAIDSFFNQVRRSINILERPLYSAKGKSYIYSNHNPRYAQQHLTIFRTFYNFCNPFKDYKGVSLTPAQRIGLTDKVFNKEDIIYFS